jgi:hypothetical protein
MKSNRHHLGGTRFALSIELVESPNQVGGKIIRAEKRVVTPVLVVICIETIVSYLSALKLTRMAQREVPVPVHEASRSSEVDRRCNHPNSTLVEVLPPRMSLLPMHVIAHQPCSGPYHNTSRQVVYR